MLNPNDFVPIVKSATYSYKEGISNCLKIIAVVSIFALISMTISLIIGIRKKDCVAILTVNIMVKTIAVILYQVVVDLLNLDNGFLIISLIIVAFVAPTIIEGLIYEKVLKYKKYKGMTVSLICNIGTVIISFLIITIFGSKSLKLLNALF